MDRSNLTVLTGATVTRVILDGKRAAAVDVLHGGGLKRIAAAREIVLSMGAINTPKVLMQSGIGDADHLRQFGIDVVQHLPGVGQNLQDHILLAGFLWEYANPLPLRNNGAEATLFWKSDAALDTPDLQPFQIELPLVSDMTAALNPPAASWTIAPGLARVTSRGRVWLMGASPSDPLDIDANLMSDPADMRAAIACVRLCREIGNSPAMRPFAKRELMPGDLGRAEMENFVRDAVVPYWHQACTAKMGRDEMSVVDGSLKVYGIDGLRVADSSVLPRLTTGNTMAPCVIVGERGAEAIRQQHGL
jgi:choline dehydrogenase